MEENELVYYPKMLARHIAKQMEQYTKEKVKKPGKNFSGNKIGKIVVLYKTKSIRRKNGQSMAQWVCLCNCGNVIILGTHSLTHVKSLSCTRCKQTDIAGQKFGRLIAIKPLDEIMNKCTKWLCKCECGKEYIVLCTDLLNGNTKSCGCLHKDVMYNLKTVDITNQKFGLLTALKIVGKNNLNRVMWLCICDCGNYCIASGQQLRAGNKSSCGCIKSQGEGIIINILQNANIEFSHQHSFDNCRFPDTNRKAVFDFYIGNRYIIEFDGSQHFKYCKREAFIRLRKKDLLKDNYCFDHNIPIIRIPYHHIGKICLEDLLLETSQFIVTSENESSYFKNSAEILGGDLEWINAEKLLA